MNHIKANTLLKRASKMERVLNISNTKYNIVNTISNDNYLYAIIENNNKKKFVKILKKNDESYIESLNLEIDFLTNNNIDNVPKIVNYKRDKYILYEFIDGSNLKQLNPSNKEIISIMIKLCDILKKIHDLGYCHNDIKKSNIMISGKDVILIDFGNCIKFNSIAKFCSPKTASYELLEKKEVNYLSDIFSLGAVLEELITDNIEDVKKIIQKCKNRVKRERYQSVIELKNDLLKISL